MEKAGQDAGGGGLGPGEATCRAIPHQHNSYMPSVEIKVNVKIILNINNCNAS